MYQQLIFIVQYMDVWVLGLSLLLQLALFQQPTATVNDAAPTQKAGIWRSTVEWACKDAS